MGVGKASCNEVVASDSRVLLAATRTADVFDVIAAFR